MDEDDESATMGCSDQALQSGYCHFNDNADNVFRISFCGLDIEIKQAPASTALGHGAVVWDAAVVFSKFMEKHPEEFSNLKLQTKSVVELGSGCGLAGISFMLKGARVTFTDLCQVVASLTDHNVNKIYKRVISMGQGCSGTLIQPGVLALDWLDASAQGTSPPYDIILLTDCVFSADLVPHLIGHLIRLSGPKTVIWCCHEIRDEEANELFMSEFKKMFHVKRISRSKLHPDYSNDLIELLSARRIRGNKGLK